MKKPITFMTQLFAESNVAKSLASEYLPRRRTNMALARLLVLATTLLMASQSYAGIIYNVNQTVGGATVVGTITTDGTIGVLDDINIAAFSLVLDDGTYNVPISDVNGGTHFVMSGTAFPGTTVGSPLSATATQLLFDFTSTGFVHFQLDMVDTGTPFWCLAGSASTGHCVNFTGGQSIKTSKSAAVSYTSANNSQSLVVVANVPEPGTLVLLGMGLLGLVAVRRLAA